MLNNKLDNLETHEFVNSIISMIQSLNTRLYNQKMKLSTWEFVISIAFVILMLRNELDNYRTKNDSGNSRQDL